MSVDGLSFLVPFNYDVIPQTLEEKYGIRVKGEPFLEKIFDYGMNIPSPAPDQRLAFLAENLAEHVTAFPTYALNIFRDTLPRTPRRLKSLVRHIYLQASVTSPKTVDEWLIVTVTELIRQIARADYEYIMEKIQTSGKTTPATIIRIITEFVAIRKSKSYIGLADEIVLHMLREVVRCVEIIIAPDIENVRLTHDDPSNGEALALIWRQVNGPEHAPQLELNFRNFIGGESGADSKIDILLRCIIEYRFDILTQTKRWISSSLDRLREPIGLLRLVLEAALSICVTAISFLCRLQWDAVNIRYRYYLPHDLFDILFLQLSKSSSQSRHY